MSQGLGSTGPSGRSPFPPSRSTRRIGPRPSMDGLDESVSTSSSLQQSPFLQGLLRFSPNNAGNSPYNRSGGSRQRMRFFHENNNNTANQQLGICNNSSKSSLDEASNSETMDGIPMDALRTLATQALLQSPEQASFYASIVYTKSGTADDAFLLAQALLNQQKYAACLRILEDSNILQSDEPWEALLVACQALSKTDQWTTLSEVLEDASRLPAFENTSSLFPRIATSQPLEDNDDMGWQQLQQSIASSAAIHPLARIAYWRGLAYHETGHGPRAATFWKRALKIDCQCQSAWEALLSRQLITPAEAHALLQTVSFAKNQEWLRSMYLARIELTPQDVSVSTTGQAAEMTDSFQLHDASSIQLSSPMPKFATPGDVHFQLNDDNDNRATKHPVQSNVDEAFENLCNVYKLQHSPQVLAMAARRAYRRYDWKQTIAVCEELDQFDPALANASYCYVSTLVLLGHKRVLFRLAHEWVEAAPKSAQAWFAVGAYYYCCERYHVAQRHFCRATRLDPQCTEAWIAFGCSFAACDESDQALASFRAAQRLSPGEHTSLLYMGVEYTRTNHLVLASYFLEAAMKTSGGDPLCLHELGVLSLQKGEHAKAIQWFQRALSSLFGVQCVKDCIELCADPYWEPTLFNLGHSYRKSRQFDLAGLCFKRCVSLRPDKFSTYSALAFTRHLLGEFDSAIESYHKALSLKPNDSFSTEMLNKALLEVLGGEKSTFFDEIPTTTGSTFGNVPLLTPQDESMMSEEMESDVSMS
jgi:anaphase-promoting complex subunit 6